MGNACASRQGAAELVAATGILVKLLHGHCRSLFSVPRRARYFSLFRSNMSQSRYAKIAKIPVKARTGQRQPMNRETSSVSLVINVRRVEE